MAIISYDMLEGALGRTEELLNSIEDGGKLSAKELDTSFELLLTDQVSLIKSHMELQCRNEKLRTRNSRLISIVSNIRRDLNGG